MQRSDLELARPATTVVKRACACGGSHEQKADRDPVLQMQRQIGNRATREILARAREQNDESPIETSIQQARGSGQPLDRGVKTQMESSMGTDFSGVQVHTDARSNNLNESLSARAFTTGHDVFFRSGAYNPGSSSGRELIAHELTHVMQQRGEEPGKK